MCYGSEGLYLDPFLLSLLIRFHPLLAVICSRFNRRGILKGSTIIHFSEGHQ